MKLNTKVAFGTAALLAALTFGSLGYAADEPAKPAPERGERGPGGGGGRGGGMDFAAMRKEREDRLKADLGATDDEWKLMQPRIEKVVTSRMQAFASGRGMGGGGRRGGGEGGGAGGGDRPQSEVGKASEELHKVLDDKAATADTIKAKLEALRAAREKARQDTIKAQAELKEILTARQEAVLVANGVLE
jgi:Spy/CpxP family protein refolding chaperone